MFGAATQIAYSAGKAAVIGLTRTLAKEWGRFDVTVVATSTESNGDTLAGQRVATDTPAWEGTGGNTE